MNLPSLVHHTQHQNHFPQPIPGHGHLHEPSLYAVQQQQQRQLHQQQHHQQHHHHHRSSYPQHSSEYNSHPPAPPPSPPVEDNSKCSLPSISTLLVYADGGQSNGNGSERQQSSQTQPTQNYQPQPSRVILPPTPPMRPDSVFEGNSPTMSSQSPSTYYYTPSSNQGHRNSYPPPQKPTYSPHPEHSYNSQSPYYPPPQIQHIPGYKQHMVPHPPTQSPHQLMLPASVAPPTTSNPWQYHNHSAPASHAAFPQSQDRYICQTCNKAFSRPSSLRIHSHSHTGEKPFKCPHHGCGKAFSVRSNMKRHERGCHG